LENKRKLIVFKQHLVFRLQRPHSRGARLYGAALHSRR